MDGTSKRCTKCLSDFPIDDFPFANKAKGTRQSRCKGCVKARSKQWYLDNKERHLEGCKAGTKRWRAKKKLEAQELVNSIKSGPCTDCKHSFRPWQMQFDHRDPTTKEFNVASAVHHAFEHPIETILREIEKCDLVCANCHADRTYRRNHPEEFS